MPLVISAFISSLQVLSFDAVNKLESFLPPVSIIHVCVPSVRRLDVWGGGVHQH